MKKIKRSRSPSPKRKSPSKSNFVFGRGGKRPFPINSVLINSVPIKSVQDKKKAYEELYNQILDIINKK